MLGFKISMIIIGLVVLICGIVGVVYSFLVYKQKQKLASYILFGMSMFSILLFCTVFPIGTEEYTSTATIKGVGNSFIKYNAAYVEIDGQTEEISVGEYNRNMFDILTGNVVELTYGKIHTIFGIGEGWRFVDLKIPQSD